MNASNIWIFSSDDFCHGIYTTINTVKMLKVAFNWLSRIDNVFFSDSRKTINMTVLHKSSDLAIVSTGTILSFDTWILPFHGSV